MRESSANSGRNSSERDAEEAGLKFAQCMREHGVDMPDPGVGRGGGLTGAALGAAITVAYASNRGWIAVVPPAALAAGIGAAIAIGALAGLYPAVRAARLSPTDALRSV